jgi:FkbM family methyltransferase
MSLFSKLIPNSVKETLKQQLGVPNMFWSLENIKNNGFSPAKIIDIGAYTGEWTKEIKQIFPNAAVLMIEAQSQKETALKQVKNTLSNVQYAITLLGADDNQLVTFNELETASSVLAEHHQTNATATQKPLKKLDTLLSENGFGYPDLIKLDTQGYELEILKGGSLALQKAEVVLMEVSLLDIHKNCPLIHDVINFMFDHHFIAYDICSLTCRPLDKALWQTDMIFVKKSSKLIANKKWN